MIYIGPIGVEFEIDASVINDLLEAKNELHKDQKRLPKHSYARHIINFTIGAVDYHIARASNIK